MANEVESQGFTAVAVGPGFMRTEAILEGLGVSEANWRDALGNPAGPSHGVGRLRDGRVSLTARSMPLPCCRRLDSASRQDGAVRQGRMGRVIGRRAQCRRRDKA